MKNIIFSFFLFFIFATKVFSQEHPLFFIFGNCIFKEFAKSENYDVDDPIVLKRTRNFIKQNKWDLSEFNATVNVPDKMAEKYFLPMPNQKLWVFYENKLVGTTEKSTTYILGRGEELGHKYELSFSPDLSRLEQSSDKTSGIEVGNSIFVWVPKNTPKKDQPHVSGVSKEEKKNF